MTLDQLKMIAYLPVTLSLSGTALADRPSRRGRWRSYSDYNAYADQQCSNREANDKASVGLFRWRYVGKPFYPTVSITRLWLV